MTTPMTPEDYHHLMRISCEIYGIAEKISQLGDDALADELMYLQMVIAAFVINPALRARQNGARSLEEWRVFCHYMSYIGKVHQDFAERYAKGKESEEEPTEEVKDDDDVQRL